MVRKPLSANELKHSPGHAGPQGGDWTSISIAVSTDMKRDFVALADRMHLAPSQYGRTLIAEAIARSKAA